MEEKKVDQPEVKFLNSFSMAVPDKDGVVKHLQFVVVQNLDDGKIICYFDVVDPTRIKLADEVSESGDPT